VSTHFLFIASTGIFAEEQYRTINIIGFLADSTPLLERYVGFWVAYLVPCCAMWLALLPVLFGSNYFSE
jgi:POT family proton-dependent oligopeptide transporter